MKCTEFIRRAQEIQVEQENKSLLAIPEYLKAIDACSGSDNEYELLYANYQVMWISSYHDNQQAAEYGEKCLELLKPVIESGSGWHFTEIGQFHEEVILYATNCVAWYGFGQTDDKAELERLLDLVSMGCRYAESPEYFYIFDTKVRILLKLGRTEEAFGIVRTCLKKNSGFADFNDIVAEQDYRAWKANFEAGIVTELTDLERDMLQKAERIAAKLKQNIVDSDTSGKDFTELIPQKEIVSLGEAKEKYKISNYHDPSDSVLVFKGDVFVKGSVNNAWLMDQLKGMAWENNLFGVIIDGNLMVEGDVIDDEYLELFVIRNLICNYVFSSNGIIEIKSNANVKYGIYGEYNDGSLDIYGKLITPYLISYDHSMPRVAEGDFIYIEGGNGTDRESMAINDGSGGYHEDSQKLFSPAVWDDKDEFSVDNFFEIVRRGESPFIKLKD